MRIVCLSAGLKLPRTVATSKMFGDEDILKLSNYGILTSWSIAEFFPHTTTDLAEGFVVLKMFSEKTGILTPENQPISIQGSIWTTWTARIRCAWRGPSILVVPCGIARREQRYPPRKASRALVAGSKKHQVDSNVSMSRYDFLILVCFLCPCPEYRFGPCDETVAVLLDISHGDDVLDAVLTETWSPRWMSPDVQGDNGVLVAENLKILLSKFSPREIVKRKMLVYDCLMISRNLCELVVHTLIPCRFFLQPCAMHFLILVVDSQNVFTPTGIICSKATTVPGTLMGQYQPVSFHCDRTALSYLFQSDS